MLNMLADLREDATEFFLFLLLNSYIFPLLSSVVAHVDANKLSVFTCKQFSFQKLFSVFLAQFKFFALVRFVGFDCMWRKKKREKNRQDKAGGV